MSGNDIVNRLTVIVVLFFAVEFSLLTLALVCVGNFEVAAMIALISTIVWLVAKKLRND